MDIPDGFILYGARVRVGRCLYNGNITIPVWLEAFPIGKTIQYIAHELAHAYVYIDTGGWNHNALFMKHMMLLCPKKHWHYELSYLPRAASAAGIKEKHYEAR